jgi:hypothetical protein
MIRSVHYQASLYYTGNMEIVAQSDVYAPSVDDVGAFVDCVPSFAALPRGIRCPCGARKDKVYDTRSIFLDHTKTKRHQAWLVNLNRNKGNLYIENEENKALVKDQRRIIADMDAELRRKTANIDILLAQLTATRTYTETANLLDIDMA